MAVDIEKDSSSINQHLTTLQNIIIRMASNSSACKNWCITIVSAIFVLSFQKGNSPINQFIIIPVIVFLYMDLYYLVMENMFRNSYNSFVIRLHSGMDRSELFKIAPSGSAWKAIGKSLISPAIFPFYGTIIILRCVLG